MNSGFCGIPGMSQPHLDRCEGCAHNKGLFNLDCELYSTASKRRTARALCWNVTTLNHLREVTPSEL